MPTVGKFADMFLSEIKKDIIVHTYNVTYKPFLDIGVPLYESAIPLHKNLSLQCLYTNVECPYIVTYNICTKDFQEAYFKFKEIQKKKIIAYYIKNYETLLVKTGPRIYKDPLFHNVEVPRGIVFSNKEYNSRQIKGAVWFYNTLIKCPEIIKHAFA